MEKEYILVINLGSTSTKIAVYRDNVEVFKDNVTHTNNELAPFKDIWDQTDFRRQIVLTTIADHQIQKEQLKAVVSRGGNMKPVRGGIYEITTPMLNDIKSEKYGVHPTGIGCFIAKEISDQLGIPAITLDPPVTDELSPLARYSGTKDITRMSSFHALSQKSTARKICENELNKPYDETKLIVVHMGGGISVGAHLLGQIVDVNNALDGDGPFSPERAGSLPVGDLVRMCFSGKYTEKEVFKKLKGEGGLMSYLGTNSGLEVTNRIEKGDEKAKEVFEAMAYQIAKEIGAAAAVLSGQVDAIILTGSLAYSDLLVNGIRQRVEFIAPLYTEPGENEMQSLVDGAKRYLDGLEATQPY